MNENLNLVEILKDCPKGTKLYSTVYGDVKFDRIEGEKGFPVKYIISDGSFGSVTAQGLVLSCYDGECTLFSSREQRDWNLFTVPGFKKPKFDPKTLKPFDKVLVRDEKNEYWSCHFFTRIRDEEGIRYKYVTGNGDYKYCIPYNDDTWHLLCTADEAPEYYRYWDV